MKINSVAFEAIGDKKRIQPKGIPAEQTPTNKTGIKSYNKALGVFLFLFGIASCIKDAEGKTWFVNKSSLRGWGKANSGVEKFKLRNLDQLLQDMKTRYTEERIGKELWLREKLQVSKDTIERVNIAAKYLQKQGFEFVGILADGNCFVNAFLGSFQYLNKPNLILKVEADQGKYLRDMLSGQIKKENPRRAEEIKTDKEHITVNEGEMLSFFQPIRFITPIEGGDISDMLALQGKETENWDDIEDKPKKGDYILIVDLGGHFVTAKPIKS